MRISETTIEHTTTSAPGDLTTTLATMTEEGTTSNYNISQNTSYERRV